MSSRRAASSDGLRWSSVYPDLDFSWIQAVQRLSEKPKFRKELARILDQLPDLRWSDLEALAERNLSTSEAVALASLYLYGVLPVRRGDYIEIATAMPAWLKTATLRGATLKNAPRFQTEAEASEYVNRRVREMGKGFYKSPEYAEIYPEWKRLHEQERTGAGETALRESSMWYGDLVYYDLVSPFGQVDNLEGVIVRSKKGPHVKLDQPFQGKRNVGWHKGFRKRKATNNPAAVKARLMK